MSGSQSEIERKFIVGRVPIDLSPLPQKWMRQGYLVIDDDRKLAVRIRKEGADYRLAIKKGGGLARIEVEVPLDREQFEALWPETGDINLEKIRYYIRHEGYIIEVDLFEGRLRGFVMAEVEFESADDAEAFVPPSWFGREVTHDPRFLNQNLARYGRPEDVAEARPEDAG